MKLTEIYSELSESYPYRVELHAHSSPASGCSEIPPEKLVELYADKKVDALCITNHYTPALLTNGKSREQTVSEYLDDFHRAAAEGEKRGVAVILGAELRFIENSDDFLIFGIDDKDIDDFYDHVGNSVADFRKNWHKDGSFFLQAHPFRNGMVLVDPELLDGVEAFNMHPNHNSRVGIAAGYSVENALIPTIGTDCHHFGHEAIGLIRTKALPKTSDDIAQILYSRDYIFEINCFLMIPPFGTMI